jgi:HK97 family phage prohead protease
MKNDKEMRNVEFRATEEEGKMILEGYPVIFNQETLIGDPEWGWYEVIDKKALDDADLSDVPLKYNHGDAKGILARTRNGSLKLTIDNKGLKMRAELIDTTDNVDIYKCVKSGLLDKMSFAFNVIEDNVEQKAGETPRRTITKIGRLFDVAVVDLPAYDQTSIYARSKEIVGERLRNLQPSLESDEAVLENAEDRSKEKLELEKLKFEILYGKGE